MNVEVTVVTIHPSLEIKLSCYNKEYSLTIWKDIDEWFDVSYDHGGPYGDLWRCDQLDGLLTMLDDHKKGRSCSDGIRISIF